MAGVFISYRQSDSKAWAAFLRDELVDLFAPEQIFLDRDTLHAGSWREQIQSAVSQCNVTLVVIGRGWLDEVNRQRLTQPDDVHRHEIAAALARQDMRVIPVLVDDAPMPRPEQLPPDLHPLLECQARRFSDNAAYRSVDVQALASDIDNAGGVRRKAPLAPADPASVPQPAAQKHHVPFKLTEGQAREAFGRWVAGLTLAPKDVAQAARISALAAAWVPFWLGSISLTAPWTGQRTRSRTELQTVTGNDGKTSQRSVPVEEVVTVSGTLAHRFDDLVLDAGVGLPGALPTLLGEGSARRVCSAAALPDAGVPVKPASVSIERAEIELQRQAQDKAKALVRSEIGGDKPEVTQLQPLYSGTSLRLVHQPVYLGSYQYGNKDYAFTVNADTGETDGDSPLSSTKVGLIVAAVLAVVALVVLYFMKR